MVAANADNRKSALPEFEDEIQNALAVRSPVDEVAQQVDAVGRRRAERILDQLPQGGGTAMDIAYDESARHHLFSPFRDRKLTILRLCSSYRFRRNAPRLLRM